MSLVYWNPFLTAECPRSLDHSSIPSSQGIVCLQFEYRRKAFFSRCPWATGKFFINEP